MFKKALWLVLAWVLAAPVAAFDPATPYPPELKPGPSQSQVAHLAADLIARYHYQALPLDDALSEKIFDNYLKALDAEKLIFVQADIDRLAAMRTRLDDAIRGEDLGIPFAIFNRYVQRATERIGYARGLLRDGFDFRQRESYRIVRDKEPWPQSEIEMRDLWRRQVKNDWLRLKLAGVNAVDIVAILDKRYAKRLSRIAQLKSEDAFQTFMNAYTTAIEPHTTYKGARAAEDAGIMMKLSLVGIGVVLTEKDGYTIVREVVPGGPSALSGRVSIGDRIVGVAQGEGAAMTDVQGWRMDDVVDLIRGAADSAVVLDVLPAVAVPDGKRQVVALVRKKLALEEQCAKKTILAVTAGGVMRHIGVIALPSFYHDFEARQKGERDFRSAARDVARLLGELKADRVDAVLIDLRNNGGGSLAEAVELTGLFVGNGPVVQQRDAKGEVTVERDAKAGVVWDGPLGVLINRGSASASEIFAAAIQDYGRGPVIGETSYGKGTVQAVISLDPVAKSDQAKFGELRVTVAQFFRVDGGTTQLRGVRPDIPFPESSDTETLGESSFDHPLPWRRIAAADYAPAGDITSVLPILRARHETRMKIDRDFGDLTEDIAAFKFQRSRNQVSLHEGERRRERDAAAARLASRNMRHDGARSSNYSAVGQVATTVENADLLNDGLQTDERDLAAELAAETVRKATKDILLGEAVHVLSDAVSLTQTGTVSVDD